MICIIKKIISYIVFIIPNHLFRHLIDHSSSPCFPTDFDIPPWYSEELTTHHGEDSRFFNMESITRLHLLRRREKSIQLTVRYMIGLNIYSTLSVCSMYYVVVTNDLKMLTP